MKKIFIIEDELILAEMYKEKFERAGFQTSFVLSVEEAFNYLKKERPDLILLDILLPRKNGIYFLKKLRENKKFAEIPVVVLTNYDNLQTKKESFKLGVKAYLLKTQYTPTELLEEIKKFLTR